MHMSCKVDPAGRKPLRCRLLGHTWAPTSSSLGNPHAVTVYSQCTRCLARQVVQEGAISQPVDWEWLNWHGRKVRD